MPDDKKVIVALDMMDPVVARDMAKRLSGEVFAFKVGWPRILGSNADIVVDLSRYSKVICDLKLADIPDTNSWVTQKMRENGAWGIIAHAFVGGDSLEAVVKAAGNVKTIAVVAMSHPGSSLFINKKAKELVRVAAGAGAYGIIAPGNDIKMLKKVKKIAVGLKILSPGIGTQGGSASDAIASGADYVIVGRSVCNADDPKNEVKRINAAINTVLAQRNGPAT